MSLLQSASKGTYIKSLDLPDKMHTAGTAVSHPSGSFVSKVDHLFSAIRLRIGDQKQVDLKHGCQKNATLNMARQMKNSGTLPCMTFTEMAFKGHNRHSKSLNKQ